MPFSTLFQHLQIYIFLLYKNHISVLLIFLSLYFSLNFEFWLLFLWPHNLYFRALAAIAYFFQGKWLCRVKYFSPKSLQGLSSLRRIFSEFWIFCFMDSQLLWIFPIQFLFFSLNRQLKLKKKVQKRVLFKTYYFYIWILKT